MAFSSKLGGNKMKYYAVTGTYHGSLIKAKCEGDARRTFHKFHNGESIIYFKEISAAAFFLA
jgi:hypothetical protein